MNLKILIPKYGKQIDNLKNLIKEEKERSAKEKNKETQKRRETYAPEFVAVSWLLLAALTQLFMIY